MNILGARLPLPSGPSLQPSSSKTPLLPSQGRDRFDEPRRRKPVIYRCAVECDVVEGITGGLRIGPSLAYPGTLCVLAIYGDRDKHPLFGRVLEGDRLTHVNGMPVGGSMGLVHEALASSVATGYAQARFMRKRHAYSDMSCSSSRTGSSSSEEGGDAFSRFNVHGPWVQEGQDEDVHGKPLWSLPYFLYEVHASDTLPRLAEVFGLRVDEIRRDNRERFKPGEPGALYKGQLLRIRNVEYEAARAEAAATAEKHAVWTKQTRTSSPGGLLLSEEGKGEETREEAGEEGGRVRGWHVVGEDETMEGISAMYSMPIRDIRHCNRKLFPMGEPTRLLPGMRLVVYQRESRMASHTPAAFTPDTTTTTTHYRASSTSTAQAPVVSLPDVRRRASSSPLPNVLSWATGGGVTTTSPTTRHPSALPSWPVMSAIKMPSFANRLSPRNHKSSYRYSRAGCDEEDEDDDNRC